MVSVAGRIAVVLLTLAAFLVGSGGAASAVAPSAVVVEDTAGVLDQKTLLPAVERIQFYEPTKVAVFTYNGKAADNLNEEVLRFARSRHPEWISADGQKWADGLFIFALDPVGRHVGTYMGEDRKVSLEQRSDIQDATKELFRDAQWTDGTVAGIRRAAELINQPWYRSTAFLVTAWVTGGLAALGAAAWLIVRAVTRGACRRQIDRGDRSYSNVSMDLDVTELNASTIPGSSRYGSQVLEKHRTFMERYAAATELSNRVHTLGKRSLSSRKSLKLARQFAESAAELDALDDVIADSNALLNRAGTWPTAWDRQLAPFRKDLAGLEQLLAKRHGQGDSATATALRSFRDESLREVERWTAELAEGRISPETALDRLYEARSRLSELLENHAETVIQGFARNEREAAMMREQMETAHGGLDHHRQRIYEPSILGTVYPSYMFFSVATFNSGFNTGVSSVNSARGGGSTTGYGGSGGSFSGSGSSSGF
ncbi:DUF5129 domain-containing protein [Pseudarthrobacter phenanthrenivorans]|uniref:DUF5129 domain-containing protein n=1 Tax=Pseudarthrobacter phenanthrenivorans TaxID=361575 RepID=A0A0B4DU56_PSEPS|nr:DUF5129 domain-containing protein [Pseudarthrobacter phenanthrenivorans]KIC67995.1 hypothetical protein RM50_06725 [Pseudarthrobacter phenanthrenivorans]